MKVSQRATLIMMSLAAAGVVLTFGAASPGEAPGPEELNQKAYFLLREARKAQSEKNDRLAYDKYTAAVETYRQIAKEFPDWNPAAVRAAIEEHQDKASEIGESLFKLPKGCVRICPGMTKEGNRTVLGEALAPEVKTLGPDRYEIGGFTVALTREGPLLGAECNCPDYKYRGSRFNYACKHIWAVILKERLLEQQKISVETGQ